MTKELSHEMLKPHNMRMQSLNVKKKRVREPPNVKKKTIMCDAGTTQCENETVKWEKKVKEPQNVRKELSHMTLELHNMRMELSSVRKK